MKQLSRQQKIDAIIELQKNLIAGTAIESEFTLGKYQFLVNEGFMSEKIDSSTMILYRTVAEADYEYELENIVNNGSLVDAHSASELLIRLNTNRTTQYQEEYLADKIKIIALKDFLITHQISDEGCISQCGTTA